MTNTKEKVLLVGNGINRAFGGEEWSSANLLYRLSESASGSDELNSYYKPFPLAFEELITKRVPPNAADAYDDCLKDLKDRIAKELKNIPVNEAHRMIARGSKYRTVLTTNYDYSLERAYSEKIRHVTDFREMCSEISNREILHSLHRRYEFADGQFSVWHIHGEIDDQKFSKSKTIKTSNSILIGHSQYINYVNKIYSFITQAYKDPQYRDKNILREAWIYFLFYRDIDIIGLSLDFFEIHLWWMLNLRYRINKNNTVTYYYPETSKNSTNEKWASELNADIKLETITEMLKAFGVKTKPVTCDSYDDFYCKVLR